MKRGLSVTVVAVAGAVCLADQPEPQGARLIEPFDYRGVTLNDGPLLRQVQQVRDYYLRVPNDDYLKGFRQRAGYPAPGADLGGWYSDGIFHVFGQVLSGLARMHAATGDEACREKLDMLISEWAKCIAPDGYFFPSETPKPAHYIYDKMVCGLLDAYLYAGHQEALVHLDRITAWAERNLDHSNQVVFKSMIGITEWYTLTENLDRVYLATGPTRYRDYARTWEYSAYWDLFADGKDIFGTSPGYHAYSHVNTLSGAATAYWVTGEQRCLDLIQNAYEYLQQHQVYATGGYGPGEQMRPDRVLVEYLDTMDINFEVHCGTWAAFKLAKYLMCFTGDARYGDWIERLVINGIGACIPSSPDGRVMYNAGYGLSGACKSHNMPPWACCSGTRIQAVADYHDLIFFKDKDSLYVNLFTPATVKWRHRDTVVTLRQETRFPENDWTSLQLELTRDAEFAVKLRRPGWLAGSMEVTVNGQPVASDLDERNWAVVRRRWQDRDKLNVRLPMRFAAERFPRASAQAFPAAIVYGPTVMACHSPDENPVGSIDFENLGDSFLPSPDKPLVYRLASNPEVLLRPYYDYKQGERYYMYFDPGHQWTRLPDDELTFSGEWGRNPHDDLHVAAAPGAYVEAAFTGSHVRWIGRKSHGAGKCEVSIDGKTMATVDQYASGQDVPFRYELDDLPTGKHTIRLTVLPDKNPASEGHAVNLAGFDVLSGTVVAPGASERPEAIVPAIGQLASQRWHDWRRSRTRFPIAAWSYFQRYPGTLAEYEIYAGANLTMVQTPLEQAPNAKAAGLDLIVGSWQQLHLKDEQAWERCVAFPTHEDHRVAAYGLEDEPHPNEFEGLRQVCEHIYRHDQRGAIPIIDLFPNWAVPHSRFNMSYKTYVDTFIETVRPSVLLHCHYGIMADGSTRDVYYENMELFRSKALEHDIGLMGFVLIAAHGKASRPFQHYRSPSESDLRWQVYSHLAYGAQAIWYYNYRIEAKGFGEGLVLGKTGTPTEVYPLVRAVNAELLAIGPTLLKLRSTHVVHTNPDIPKGAKPYVAGRLKSLGAFEGRGFLVGEFENVDEKTSDVYVMLVNKRHEARTRSRDLTATAVFKPRPPFTHVYRYDARTGKPVELSRDASGYRIEIDGGHGVLLRFSVRPPPA